MSLPPTVFFGPDYSDLPLLPAWYIPGWTNQNLIYTERPLNPFAAVPFPNLTYVLVTGEEFDFDGNALGGFFTFMPSDSITVQTTDPVTNIVSMNRIMQRYTGSDMFSQFGYNQAGSGKVYLFHGRLAVLLLATDNTGLVTDQGAPLTYHVKEHFRGGSEFDISVPSNSVGTGPVDIRSLIVSGPGEEIEDSGPVMEMNTLATQNIIANLSSITASLQGFDLAAFDVNFAFTTGFSQPTENDWQEGRWITSGPPYVAAILVGPRNNGLVLNAGSYTIWVRVVTGTEVPVIKIGTLIIEEE